MFLFVLQHRASALLWLGRCVTDPRDEMPMIRHWKWQALLAESDAVDLISVRHFRKRDRLDARYRDFCEEHRVKSDPKWVNSGLYQQRPSPYVYLIRHKKSGQLYIGSRYADNAVPSQFFVTYFTSSSRVRALGHHNFEIVQVLACKNARKRERRLLKSWHADLGTEHFFEIFLNRNTAPGILLDEIAIAKMRQSKRENSRKGIPHSAEHRQNISRALKGHAVSEETRAKIGAKAAARKRQPHSEETKAKMRAAYAKRPPMSELTRLKISVSRIGRTGSPELRERLSQIHRKRYQENPELRSQISASLRVTFAEKRGMS